MSIALTLAALGRPPSGMLSAAAIAFAPTPATNSRLIHRELLHPPRVAAASVDADAVFWTAGLAAAAYFSGYASEGYEPHRL